jgi:membrane protease YdiL (CAAX protease family)
LIYSLTVEAVQYAYYQGKLPITPWTYTLPVMLVRVVGILLLAPLVEELLLRGVLLAALRRKHVPIMVAIALQSSVFTVLHLGTLSPSWASMLGLLQIFVDGVLFGLARYHTGSLYPAIAMHMLGNCIAVAERVWPR